MILQTLYQQCIKQGVTFFDEFHMLDLVMVDGECRGPWPSRSPRATSTPSTPRAS